MKNVVYTCSLLGKRTMAFTRFSKESVTQKKDVNSRIRKMSKSPSKYLLLIKELFEVEFMCVLGQS